VSLTAASLWQSLKICNSDVVTHSSVDVIDGNRPSLAAVCTCMIVYEQRSGHLFVGVHTVVSTEVLV
jgi:hypothetical protein